MLIWHLIAGIEDQANSNSFFFFLFGRFFIVAEVGGRLAVVIFRLFPLMPYLLAGTSQNCCFTALQEER